MCSFAGSADSGVFCDAKISITPNGAFGFSAGALRRINFSMGSGMRVRNLPGWRRLPGSSRCLTRLRCGQSRVIALGIPRAA